MCVCACVCADAGVCVYICALCSSSCFPIRPRLPVSACFSSRALRLPLPLPHGRVPLCVQDHRAKERQDEPPRPPAKAMDYSSSSEGSESSDESESGDAPEEAEQSPGDR